MSSKPPPKETATTAMPSTSAKLLKLDTGGEPEAGRGASGRCRARLTQLLHRIVGSPTPRVERLDHDEVAEGAEGSAGKTRSRLMPKPPPIPVTKKAGGPPIGPVTAPNAKKAVKPRHRR